MKSNSVEYSCRRFDVCFEQRGERTYYYLDMPNAVAAIPRYKGKIILVKENRTSVNQVFLELPGGRVEEGENPDQAILREVREEIGVVRCTATLLKEYYPMPSLTNQKITYYVIDIEELGEPDREESEADMETVYIDEKEIHSVLSSMNSAIEAVGLYAYLEDKRWNQ